MRRRRSGRHALGVAVLVVMTAACTGSGSSDDERTGGSVVTGQGIGDAYYADDGNLGYDVRGYDVRLDYDDRQRRIDARTTIEATAADEALPGFNVDLLGLEVTAVEVDGVAAEFDRSDAHELVITPARPVAAGAAFTTVVSYHGKPGVDPVSAVHSGWYDARTPGGGFVAGEPHSCTVWYPCNDHPTDKATFALTATVPRPFAVVSVGTQGRTTPTQLEDRPARTYRWRLEVPVAPYLTTMYIDRLDFERSRLADGTPVVSAYGPLPGRSRHREARLPEILDVLTEAWGPYPAPEAGGIFVNGEVPFSLETFTRPIYSEGVDVNTIVHENGHQWWGDNVSIERWKDICLNECFASYSVWLWHEAHGADLDARYHAALDDPGSWLYYPLYDMGPGHEFDGPGVYYKGVFFLHALRHKLGDDQFFSALQGIQHDHARGNLSMLGLRDELEQRTGADLEGFWDDWVLSSDLPSSENLYPGTLSE